jgi:hypothetical protein
MGQKGGCAAMMVTGMFVVRCMFMLLMVMFVTRRSTRRYLIGKDGWGRGRI